jgi:hypothetical protein
VRKARAWVFALLLVAGSRAAMAQSSGEADWFGRGIVGVRDQGTAVYLDLRVGAPGLLLRLAEGEPVRVLQAGAFPAGLSVVRIPARQAGAATAVTRPGSGPLDPARSEQDARAARRDCEARGRAGNTDSLMAATRRGECSTIRARAEQPPRTTTVLRAPAPEYLLLVLSDQPLDSADLGRRLAELPPFDVATAAHDVAEYLVGRRSPMWAGYLARR